MIEITSRQAGKTAMRSSPSRILHVRDREHENQSIVRLLNRSQHPGAQLQVRADTASSKLHLRES
jgi:hypothetical protein